MPIEITNGALDEAVEGLIVLRGLLSPSSLTELTTPKYQRETMPRSTLKGIIDAMKAGSRVPDVELAARKGNYASQERDGVWKLTGEINIVDGLQRISAGRQVIAEGGSPAIGCAIYFDTSEAWEMQRFEILNRKRVAVSPNVSLRNRTLNCPSMKLLYDLCLDHSFVLADRVCWSQRMQRQELLSALVLLKVAMRIHTRFNPGRTNQVSYLIDALPATVRAVGRNNFRDNIKAFFGLIDECFGIRTVVYRERTIHLRGCFLITLGTVMADHEAFWKGQKLIIDRDFRAKLAKFPVNDPSVVAMTCSTESTFLGTLIVDHINAGKRTRRLVPFNTRTFGTRTVPSSNPADGCAAPDARAAS